MSTKAILDRVEQPDLSGYTTDAEFDNLSEIVDVNSADIEWLKNKLNSLTADNLVRTQRFGTSGYLTAGTYSYNLADYLNITDPVNWNFQILAALEGYQVVGGGYGGFVTSQNADINSYTSGHIGYVTIASNSTAGYHGRTSAVSYTCLAIATRK